MADKVIITCALTGAQQGKDANPNLPEQPEEIISQGLDAWRAGAAVLHIHARDGIGKPTSDVSIFREIVERLKGKGCEAILNLTTGGAVAGIPIEDRMRIIPGLKPQIASFSAGSGSLLARHDPKTGKMLRDQFVQLFSSFADMEKAARIMLENGTKPEVEIYHAGMINNLKMLMDRGALKEPVFVNFVTGIPGEVTEATVKNLLFLKESLPPGCVWHASGIGARNHFRIATAAVLLGGHMRVGLEDNVYIGPGELAESNAQLVKKGAHIIKGLGLETATPVEAAKILGVNI